MPLDASDMHTRWVKPCKGEGRHPKYAWVCIKDAYNVEASEMYD